MNLCTDVSLISLINLLNYTSYALICAVGSLVVVWFLLEVFFKMDLLDLLFKNTSIVSEPYKFFEIFLYAFGFGLLATVFNDLLRNYDGYTIYLIDFMEFIKYYILLFGTIVFVSAIVWIKYKDKSMPDLLFSLLAIPIILVLLSVLYITPSLDILSLLLFIFMISLFVCYFSFIKSKNKDFSKESLKLKISEFKIFCLKRKISNILHIVIFSVGFTTLFFLLDNFFSQNHIKFFISRENGLYYIFTFVALAFFLVSQKNRAMIINAIMPILLGGTLSVLYVNLLKILFLGS